MQVLASMVKVPLLFYLTLLVTLPSLYVFNALVGSRLRAGGCSAAGGVAGRDRDGAGFAGADRGVLLGLHDELPVHGALQRRLSSRSPGLFGLRFLLQTLHRLSVADSSTAGPAAVTRSPGPGRARRAARPARERVAVRARQDGVPALGHRLRPGRRPDGLGPAAVHRQPQHAVHLVPRRASRTSSRPSSTRSPKSFLLRRLEVAAA